MHARASRSLVGDQRGAIMVMGVFMAALMVGFLYYVKGVGDAIVFRERMQDAADSAVFAAATVSARGMNLIALVNISMVAVLAVVAATRLVQTFAVVGMLLAGLQAPDLRDALKEVRNAASERETAIRRPLFGLLRAGNTAANAVAAAIPVAAEARAISTASEAFRPEVEVAFAYPRFPRLPVQNSSIDELTGRAGPPAVPLARIPFAGYPIVLNWMDGQGEAALAADGVTAARELMAIIDNPAALAGMVPQRLVGDAVAGGERLQLRVVTGGLFEGEVAEQGIGVATWGQTEAEEENQRQLRTLSRIGLAQAEYYFGGGEDRDEWLWNQSWKARLRRVRLGNPGGYPCVEQSVYCDALDELFARDLQEAVVH